MHGHAQCASPSPFPPAHPPLPVLACPALSFRAGRGGSRGGGGLFGGGSGSLDADLEDELGLGDLLLSLSRLAGESQRPNSRRWACRPWVRGAAGKLH